MAKQRQVQHRPDREKARARDLADANKEIRQLKRLISRQQKTIRKLEDERGSPIELEEASPESQPAEALPAISTAEETCVKCGASNWISITTPSGKIIRGCKNCKKTRR